MSAPNLKEVEWAISELEQEESSLPNYEKLAIFYILREKMLGDAQPDPEPPLSTYSEAAPVSMGTANSCLRLLARNHLPHC